LDLGTSAIKGTAVGEDGTVLAEAKRETTVLRPRPEWFEFSPRRHYADVCDVLAELVAGIAGPHDVAGVGLSGATGNALLVDAHDEPLTNCISWMDRRAQGESPQILPHLDGDGVHRVVGWPWRETFPLAHLAWLRYHQPEIYRQAARYCMSNDYLVRRLAGAWTMDVSTATTFYLFNQERRSWHEPYLDMLDIPPDRVSVLRECGETAGSVTAEAAERTGLPRSTQIVLGAFDHPSAARATGVRAPGEVLLSCGTSWVGLYPSADREIGLELGLLIDPFLTPDGPWALMFSLSRIGVTIQWYVETFLGSGPDGIQRFNDLAAQAPEGANGLFINPMYPLHGNEAEIRGALSDRSPADIARAVMEGTAFEIAQKMAAMAPAGVAVQRIAMVGGPSQSPVWPQIVADATALHIELVTGRNAGALGAAMLAARGAGFDLSALPARQSGARRVVEPEATAAARYQPLLSAYAETMAHRAVRG
jgi:sugar (pentulose or hexulose) kinase